MEPDLTCLGFTYPEHPEKSTKTTERRLRLHEIRDGQATLLLASALGLHCTGLFVNHPYSSGTCMKLQEEEIRKECSGITTLLLSTRPPLDDPATGNATTFGNRKRIKRSGNWLEKQVLDRLRGIFEFCDRKQIRLDDGLVVDPDLEKTHYFQSTDEAYVVSHRPSNKGSGTPKEWTLGYFVRLDALWPDGPGLVCAFGLSGPMTLLWCNLLTKNEDCRKRIRVCGPRLIVARLYLDRAIPSEPHFLSFTNPWRIDFRIDKALA